MSIVEAPPDKPKVEVCKTVKKLHRKMVQDVAQIEEAVRVWKRLGHKVGMTIGTWDFWHIGHARYITAATEFCDVLVVGVDSDRAVKRYKDPGRPAYPERERAEMLCYLPVDIVSIIDDVDDEGKWQNGLLKAVRPDVFIAVEDSYPQEQIEEIKQFASEVVVLPRQAETSTSFMIRNLLKINLPMLIEKLREVM